MKGIRRSLKEQIAYLRLLSGDSDAFGYFYDQMAGKIYSYIYFRTSDKEFAQDATHEVFLQAWQYILEKKDIRNLQAYLYQIARNKIADLYRTRNRQPDLFDDHSEYTADTQHQERLDHSAEMAILRRHLAELKEEYREIIILRHMEGLSISEIAIVIGKDENSVRVTLHRALAKLKSINQTSSNDSPVITTKE